MGERRVLGVKRERNQPREASGLVLQLAQTDQVVHTVLGGLDVPVEHRRVRADSLEMALAGDLEPPLARDLVPADHVADALLEYLRAAAGTGVHPRVLQVPDRLRDRSAADVRDPVELHHRKGLPMDPRESLLERAKQARVVVVRPGRVQATDDVELRHRVAVSAARLGDALVDGELVTPRLVHLLRPRAERTVDPAEVRRVQIPVDVVKRGVAVPSLPDVVGEAAEADEIARRGEPDSVVEGESLAGKNFLGDRRQIRPTEGRGEPPRPGHGIAGFVTGWYGFCCSVAISSTKGCRYR